MNIFVVKIKNYILPMLFLFFTICLILFSSSNLSAAKSGLVLWSSSIVPSLFPFFVATELLSQTNIPFLFGRIFNVFMKPLFNIHGEGSFAFIMGIISGYPVGAKIACNFRKNNVLPKVECERLSALLITLGPLFIVGTVGISMFRSSSIGFFLLVIHILSSITIGILFRFWKIKNESEKFDINTSVFYDKKVSFSNIGEIIASAISNATSTVLMIGGFVVLFSVIISILYESNILKLFSFTLFPVFEFLRISPTFISPLITGILEITNGIAKISNIFTKDFSLNIIFTSFLLGFGGISVFLQVFSITSKTDLSIKPYIIGKLLQGLISALYTFSFLKIFPVF